MGSGCTCVYNGRPSCQFIEPFGARLAKNARPRVDPGRGRAGGRPGASQTCPYVTRQSKEGGEGPRRTAEPGETYKQTRQLDEWMCSKIEWTNREAKGQRARLADQGRDNYIFY